MGSTSCVRIPGHVGTGGQDSSEVAAEAAVKAGVVGFYQHRSQTLRIDNNLDSRGLVNTKEYASELTNEGLKIQSGTGRSSKHDTQSES
jgi:hypothetical protein